MNKIKNLLKKITALIRGYNHDQEIRKLHPDFKQTADGYWYFNRLPSFIDIGFTTQKVRVIFDNPRLLSNCRYLAKVGRNNDNPDHGKYAAFIYGVKKDTDGIIKFAAKFPHAILIDSLNYRGEATPLSVFTDVKQNPFVRLQTNYCGT